MKLRWKKFSITLACLTAVLPIEAALGQSFFRSDVVGSLTSGNAGIWGTWAITKYCPEGSWASGFGQRVEKPQGGGDDTALNSVVLYCTNREGKAVGSYVSSDLGYWGDWAYSHCPQGTHMTHFRLKKEKVSVPGDNTAANAVSFWCSNGMGIRAQNDGSWGNWGSWKGFDISTNMAICGLSQKTHSQQGIGDDTALNDIRLYWCRR
jgi:hypothetical protein